MIMAGAESVLYSVIIPVYNCEKYISRAVDSILNQTVSDFELILVDDGATDSSGIICDQYSSADQRVKVVHKQNGGVSSARNAGLDACTGKYVVFLDSDDYVDDNYLEKFNKYESDLVVSGYCLENEKSEILLIRDCPEKEYKITKNSTFVSQDFVNGYFNYACTKRFRRSVLCDHNIRFFEQLKFSEDTLFVMDYISYVNSISQMQSHSYHYVKYEHETLSNLGISETFVHQMETANDVIAKSLEKTFGDEAEQLTVCRMGPIYRDFLFGIINSGQCDPALISELFRQKWFRKVISQKDFLLNENWKFRMILRTKSAFLFQVYLKYQNRK